jgi:hypothetical protein
MYLPTAFCPLFLFGAQVRVVSVELDMLDIQLDRKRVPHVSQSLGVPDEVIEFLISKSLGIETMILSFITFLEESSILKSSAFSVPR